jgi:hypothetical protein
VFHTARSRADPTEGFANHSLTPDCFSGLVIIFSQMRNKAVISFSYAGIQLDGQ